MDGKSIRGNRGRANARQALHPAGTGLPVRCVEPDSCARKAGIRRGDRIVEIDGEAVSDEVDLMFLLARPRPEVTFVRKGRIRKNILRRIPGRPSGIQPAPTAIRRCPNRCVFCFVDQLPRGMRKSLYVKDEDTALSFLYGNYVTLASARRDELDRIVRQGRSPLYISVHTTNDTVRRRMLRNSRAPAIMKLLGFLAGNGISLHTQIVLCPGYNDGEAELRSTIEDLLSLGDRLRSVAIVPVGLTKYHTGGLHPVGIEQARRTCLLVETVGERDKARGGVRRVFASDELFLRARLPLPPLDYYEDYPQIENGVGLVRRLREEWNGCGARILRRARSGALSGASCRVIVTSVAASEVLSPIIEQLQAVLGAATVRLLPVVNRRFGASVTVAGLLCAADIAAAVRRAGTPTDCVVVVPDVIFNYRGYTLDGFSVGRLGSLMRRRVVKAACVSEMVELPADEGKADSGRDT